MSLNYSVDGVGLNLFLGRQDNVGRFLFAEPQFTLGLPNGSWRKSLLLAVLVLILLCSAGAFYARCWLPLALLCRDKFAPLEENGNYHEVTYFFTSLITGLTAGLILHSTVLCSNGFFLIPPLLQFEKNSRRIKSRSLNPNCLSRCFK